MGFSRYFMDNLYIFPQEVFTLDPANSIHDTFDPS